MVQKPVSIDLPSFKHAPQSSTASRTKPSTVTQGQKARITTPATAHAGKFPEVAALPFLPKTKRPNFSSHRNDANAALALDLLAGVGEAITGWHQALRQILLDIQALYRTGPIIEGWLESIPTQGKSGNSSEDASVLRHGDAEQLAAYVEKFAQAPQTEVSEGVRYRLCSLDADGKVQCQTCPSEQLGVVSQAIARHQQLRQLLNQKQYLEARLQRAAEALEATRKALDLK
ncbi:MAG: hypothetical protein AAFW75_15905 [Cyanobacteria bacterium J06636_16]